jgi:hypothetical protein
MEFEGEPTGVPDGLDGTLKLRNGVMDDCQTFGQTS